MVSERLKTLFGKVKKGLSEKLSEIKPEDIAKFAAKEAIRVIPVVGQIIKDVFDEFSPDEKEELIKELKELSESQFNEISKKVGVSVEYLKDIRGITLYTFEELRADHEEIEKLSLHLIEIQTREINIPSIQAVLRKGEPKEADFFKKEPEWVDFEEDFVVERKEVDEIINKLKNDTIQLVLGEPASGKSVILKNIGFKLAKENKEVYLVELKKHSRDDVKRYFDDILSSTEKAVFIVDDAHSQFADCEGLVRDFKSRKLKAKLIIGSRPTREIQGEHPKEPSEFEYVSKTHIHAEDVTEEMIRWFLKRKHREYNFSDERINAVSKNLEKYKKDLWFLSWALKAYNPEMDSVEEKEIYEKIRDSIRETKLGKDESGKDKFLNAEDVFLPLSVFYRFEIPIERRFLEQEQIGIEESIINQLIALSEMTEMEERGKRRTLSLNHSSIAELYFKTYQSYPDLGEKVKKIFQGEDAGIVYCMFYKYITSVPTNSLDVLIHLGRDLDDEIGGKTLLKKLIDDKKTENSIKRAIQKEGDIEKIGCFVNRIAWTSEEAALKLSDVVSSKIEKIEGREISALSLFVRNILVSSKKVGLDLGNRLNIDYLSSKMEKEEDIEKIGLYVMRIAELNKEVGLELANRINIKVLASKIEKEEDVWKIGLCVRGIAMASKGVGLELANCVNIKVLASKIEKEEDVIKIGACMGGITNASKEMALKLANAVSSETGKREDMRGIEEFLTGVMGVDREVAREIVNCLNPKLREELQKGGVLK